MLEEILHRLKQRRWSGLNSLLKTIFTNVIDLIVIHSDPERGVKFNCFLEKNNLCSLLKSLMYRSGDRSKKNSKPCDKLG